MSGLSEFEARQIIKRIHLLRSDVEVFATHARVLRLSSSSMDGLALLQSADGLLRRLKASRTDFENLISCVPSVRRSLSPRPLSIGGPPPAAQWGNEFRALSSQFAVAVRKAERELNQPYGAADAQLSSPTRTPTVPGNVIDILMNFADALSRWLEYRRCQTQRS